MICNKCGAHLLENDQFCPKCGTRVIKGKRCPDCGAALRDGVKFCPECGRAVEGRGRTAKAADETLDIPIEAIERNILSETAAEMKAERGSGRGMRKAASGERATVRRTADKEVSSGHAPARKKQDSVPAPPPRRKKPVYREEVWEDDDWEEDEDEEDDDWEDEDEGIDAITIMTVVIGCILLIVVAVLGFHMYRQYVPKNYEKAAEEREEEQEDGQDQEEGSGEGSSAGEAGGRETYTLTIESNVNVRDQPSTSGNKLKVAQAGETYTCYGSAGSGEWYEIVLEDGSTGYVHGDYVSVE